ncbi:MAG TPA: hypothetical protein VMY78_14310 [Solirubrobacteraceae bacterium]|nr:hypothetical protein [Solirubrobacteraceae bacterium]
MDLLAAWLLYPLALGALCLGLGLLVARAGAWELPGALLLPVGCAALLTFARVATSHPTTAKLALPVLALLALAGFWLGRGRLRAMRPDPWLAVAAVGVFLAFGASVIASGNPTFAGYLALPDTSHQLALAQVLAEHGPDWQSLQPGSLRSSMGSYISSRYPVGAQAALGVTAPLGVLEIAWLYQPFLSFLMVVLALSLASLAAPLLRDRRLVALVAFAASQPALVVGFVLQGSIKELAALAMIALLVAVVSAAVGAVRGARSLLPVAIAAAAALAALGPAAAPYLVLPALAAAVVWGRILLRRRERSDLLWIGAAAVVAVVLAIPALNSLRNAVEVTKVVLVDNTDLGNLAQPLQSEQAIGPWLTGDYRYEPTNNLIAQDALLILFGAAALLGLGWALRRRAPGPVLLAASLGIASLFLLARGSPYADAKVLMILSPVVPFLAMLGAASLWRGRLRLVGAAAGVAIVAGLLWSGALAYHDASLAPYDRYSEMLTINDRLAGREPVLLNEYDEFGKYFLRDVPILSEPEQKTRYRNAPYHPDALNDPRRRPSLKAPMNMDDLALEYVEAQPWLVVRRSPVASRPPANFRLDWRGRWYELWRQVDAPEVVGHKPLGGDVLQPAARVTRAVARSWAARARRLDGRIAVVERSTMAGVFPGAAQRPKLWFVFGDYPQAVVSSSPGRLEGAIDVARGGEHRLWIEGSFARRMTLRIDGAVVGRTPDELNNPGAYVALGPVRLQPGRHEVQLSQGGGDLRPGSGGYLSSLRHVGAIFVVPVSDETAPVREIDARDWRRLVGVNADWLEIVR